MNTKNILRELNKNISHQTSYKPYIFNEDTIKIKSEHRRHHFTDIIINKINKFCQFKGSSFGFIENELYISEDL